MLLGDARITPIASGTFRLDGGTHFGVVPRALWETVVAPDERNRIPMSLDLLLVESCGKRILIDTGVGNRLAKKWHKIYDIREGLMEALRANGVSPESIDIVINTHLHFDHCGGNTILAGTILKPAFPKAEYVIQEGEWLAAQSANERSRASYFPDNYWPVKEAGQIRLIRGDGEVTPEVRCILTAGHTAAHQSVVIESRGRAAIYLGDLAPWAINMERLSWVSAFDIEPLETIETKRRIRAWALEKRALLIFEHDPTVKAGYVQREGELYKVEPSSL